MNEKRIVISVVPTMIGAAICLLWVVVTGQIAPIITVGINQDRVNATASRPNKDTILKQTFIAPQHGLSAVEIRFAKRAYKDNTVIDDGLIILTIQDTENTIIAQEHLQTRFIQHNDIHEISFLPQHRSAGKQYVVTITGVDNPVTTIWGYTLDVIALGSFSGGSSDIADLRLITRHTLTGQALLFETANLIRQHALLVIALLCILPAPALLFRAPYLFPIAFCIWAIFWLWWSLIASLSGWLLWLIVIGCWLLAASCWHDTSPSFIPHYSYFILFIASLFFRFMAIRVLAFPPWVDGSHHALITKVMVTTGRMITDYQPLIDIGQPLYHTGFYAIPATIIRMVNSDLPQTLLVLGQLISSLIPLTTCTGIMMITKRRKVGLLAGFLVTFPFFFPAFYTSWGRITQLAGMLIMPIVLGLTWNTAVQVQNQLSKWKNGVLLGLLTGGLFLIHTRVFLLYVPYAIVVWIVHRFRGTKSLLVATITATIVVFPRIVQLAQLASPEKLLREIPNYNQLPLTYLNVGWERGFAYIVGGALIIAVGARLWRWRHPVTYLHSYHAWYMPVLTLMAWVLSLFCLLFGRQIGIPVPSTWVVNANSMYITLYLPAAWIISITAVAIYDRLLSIMPFLARPMLYSLLGAGITYMMLWGGRQQITILTNRTILAYAADRVAIDWINDHLPDDILIANGTWKWLGNTYAANDGSAWIVPLTGRMTTTPPHDYIYGDQWKEFVPRFNEMAIAVEDWSTIDAAEQLREAGVTHLYIGQRGSFFNPEQLNNNQAMHLIYAYDGVFIFELDR